MVAPTHIRAVAWMGAWMVAALVAIAACVGSGPRLASIDPALDFDRTAPGSLPAGWRTGTTGGVATSATWAVRDDRSANTSARVLALVATDHENQDAFHLCWTDAVQFAWGTLAVAVRADAGAIDQGGGPIWRVQDADNYYLCRCNPLEANFRVYVVTHGVRRQLGSAPIAAAAGTWHRVTVQHEDTTITCWLDDQRLLAVTDATIRRAGGVGVWTKADASTSCAAPPVRAGRVTAVPPAVAR